MKLISFDLLPEGTRFRYPGKDTVYVILEKRRIHTNTEPMCGTICTWRPDLVGKVADKGIGSFINRVNFFRFDPEEAPNGLEVVE